MSRFVLHPISLRGIYPGTVCQCCTALWGYQLNADVPLRFRSEAILQQTVAIYRLLLLNYTSIQ